MYETAKKLFNILTKEIQDKENKNNEMYEIYLNVKNYVESYNKDNYISIWNIKLTTSSVVSKDIDFNKYKIERILIESGLHYESKRHNMKDILFIYL